MMFLAGALGNGFYYQGLTLLVGSLLGPAAVVAFNATRTLTRAIAQYANTIRSSTWPEFSYLHGSRDLVRARRLAEFSLEVTGVGSLVLFGLLYWGAPVIMPLWTYGAVSADPHLVAVLLLGAVLNALAWVVSAPLAAANRHQWIAALYLLGSAVSLVAGYGLIQWLKLPGVAWSMVLCELLTLPFTIISACRVLDCTASEMLGGVLRMRSSWNEGLRFLKRRYAGQPSSRAR
jgi:O-antigen/teichoic acid export membrane protein